MESIPTIYVLILAGSGFSLVGLGYLRKIMKDDYKQSDVDSAIEHLDTFNAPDEESRTIVEVIKRILKGE